MAYVPGGPEFNQKQKDAMAWPLHKLLLTSSEDLPDEGVASLDKTTSYFTTSQVGGDTATLAAGSDGLVKIFSKVGGSPKMVITVTNPGWGGAGTLEFGSIGDACILIYVASKWNLIGNNGVGAA